MVMNLPLLEPNSIFAGSVWQLVKRIEAHTRKSIVFMSLVGRFLPECGWLNLVLFLTGHLRIYLCVPGSADKFRIQFWADLSHCFGVFFLPGELKLRIRAFLRLEVFVVNVVVEVFASFSFKGV